MRVLVNDSENIHTLLGVVEMRYFDGCLKDKETGEAVPSLLLQTKVNEFFCIPNVSLEECNRLAYDTMISGFCDLTNHEVIIPLPLLSDGAEKPC